MKEHTRRPGTATDGKYLAEPLFFFLKERTSTATKLCDRFCKIGTCCTCPKHIKSSPESHNNKTTEGTPVTPATSSTLATPATGTANHYRKRQRSDRGNTDRKAKKAKKTKTPKETVKKMVKAVQAAQGGQQEAAAVCTERFCLCQQPYDERFFYLACDVCEDWLHGQCVGITEDEAADIDHYSCPRHVH